MKPSFRTAALGFILLMMTPLTQAADRPLPPDSVFLMDATFTNQSGDEFRLADRRGRPQLVAMFYTSCRYVCPLIIDSAKAIERALTDEKRASMDILLVSLDPARDDIAALKSVSDKRKLDLKRWTLARTEEGQVRTLAALLGVRYRALADGEFNHTSSLTFLDADGRKVATTSTLGATPDAEFVAAIRKTMSSDVKSSR